MSEHSFSDDALRLTRDGGHGWVQGERFTCAACGTERRTSYETGFHVMQGKATAQKRAIYFVRGKRVDSMPACSA